MLAKKKSGTKTIIKRKRTTLSTANARSRKVWIRISGLARPSSKRTKAAIRASPATMQTQVIALPQPQTLDCCSPSTASPMPPETSSAPR